MTKNHNDKTWEKMKRWTKKSKKEKEKKTSRTTKKCKITNSKRKILKNIWKKTKNQEIHRYHREYLRKNEKSKDTSLS